MNITDLYSRVVAHRPELVVKSERGWNLTKSVATDWDWHDKDGVYIMTELHESASALIFQHWFNMLRWPHRLAPGSNNNAYLVSNIEAGRSWVGDTPIEALAAYYLSTPSTKESK